MSETIISESKKSILNSCSEPLPENLSFFLIANADQRQVHFGKLIFCSVAVFVTLFLLAMEIGLFRPLS
jgi:hypothetical protein